MRVVLIFLCFVQTYTFDLPDHVCESDLTIDKDHYNTSNVYHIGDAYPIETHFDIHGNLFFIESGRNLDGYFFDAKMIKANSTIPQRIEGLPVGQCYSVAVDSKNTRVFFGTGKGIFVYNYESEDTKLISSSNVRPNELLVDKDGNKYITESPDGVEQMYLLSGDKKIRFKTLEALNEVAIDDKNNFYFIREEKLFVLKSNLSLPILVGNVTYEGLAQISFHKNTVYVASETLFYQHENDTGSLKNVDNGPVNVSAIAFDYSSNLVLGSYGKITKYNNNSNCYHRNI